jgi:hypothetical protein
MSPEVAERVKAAVERKKSARYAASTKIADPEFLGNFLTAQLLMKINFNISEERFRKICESVPVSVHGSMSLWSFFYLSLLMRITVRDKYGEDFEAEMMRAVYGRLMNAPDEICDLTTQVAKYIRHWFDAFDREFEKLKKEGPKKVEGHEIPF